MHSKFIQQRASVLNTASAETGKPFIVSAASAAEVPQVETASFGCKACSTEFASNKGSEPFCVNCGSDNVASIKASAQPLPKTDVALAAISCKSCGTHNVLSDVTASLLDGQIHCVECGSQLVYDVDELTDPVTDADADSIEDALQTEEADTTSGEDRGGMTDDSPITDADADSIADALNTSEAAATEPEANKVPAAPDGEVTEPEQPSAPVVDPVVEIIEDDTLIEHAMFDELDKDEQDACEFSDVSLAAVILSSTPKAKLTLATAEDEILAFADGVPVARLEKANAGEHAKVFHSKSFTQSIASIAATEGLSAALSKYKFAPIRVKFPVGASARARVATKLAAETAAVEELSSSYKEDLMQCVSLAAVALNKNFYRTRASALKRGLTDMLVSAGVKGANVLVERAFAANGDAHNKQVFELATELQAKSVDFRNTLASSLGEMNPILDSMPNDDNQEVVVEHADIETRMESAALRGGRIAVTASTSSIQNLRAAAGGKLF